MSDETHSDSFDEMADKYGGGFHHLKKFSIKEIEDLISKCTTELTGRDFSCSISCMKQSTDGGVELELKLSRIIDSKCTFPLDDQKKEDEAKISMRDYLRTVSGEISLSDFVNEHGSNRLYDYLQRQAYSYGWTRVKVPLSGTCPYELTERGRIELASLNRHEQ